MGQTQLAAEHTHLFLAPDSGAALYYPIPFETRDDFKLPTTTDDEFRIDFHSVSHANYIKSHSTKGYYVKSCVNLYLKKKEQDEDYQLIAQYCAIYGPCSGQWKIWRICSSLNGGKSELVLGQRNAVDLIGFVKNDIVNILKSLN